MSIEIFRFVSRINKMGKDNLVIWIPRKYHNEMSELMDKDIRVMIDDKIWDGDKAKK